ncbi:serine hydrolase [Frankia sp. CiP3]|uniref:serine hydrolase n=1 Tax=Frankia sp. CiP3 TaxID=2880971 RepID=UPI001EF70E62|nr:serine hydrolase [Frankia sp. CiP3]
MDDVIDEVSLGSRIQDAVDAYVATEPGRSVAIDTLRGVKVRAGRNADVPRPAASLLKVIIAVAAYDKAAQGGLDLDESVSRSSLGRTAYPSVLAAFADEDLLTVHQLCRLMLITSDNAAADLILARVGIETVNETAGRLGTSHTKLVVGFRDDQLGQVGRQNITTAQDMNHVFAGLARNSRYSPILAALRNNLRNSRIPLRLPDTLPVAHKTGSLAGVVNNSGIIYGDQVDLAASFLSDHQKDQAKTSLEIGELVASVWSQLGEKLD